jgi:hypothetical protein
MSFTIINKRNAIVCDCSECGDLVEITPFNGFDPETEDTDCEWVCADCGKIVCEGCYDDFHDVVHGDADDPGGADEQKVCSDCFAKIERRRVEVKP